VSERKCSINYPVNNSGHDIESYQSTRHTVISSHGQVVTGQLVTYASRHTVNSSQAST